MICSKASNYGISYEAQVEIRARGAHEDKKGKVEIPILVPHAKQKNKVEALIVVVTPCKSLGDAIPPLDNR